MSELQLQVVPGDGDRGMERLQRSMAAVARKRRPRPRAGSPTRWRQAGRRGGWPPADELRLWPLPNEVEQIPDPNVDVAAEVLAALEAAQVRAFVHQLPPLELVVISLRFGLIGGLPPLTRAEIGERIARPAGSVWWIENKGLAMLRAMYAEDIGPRRKPQPAPGGQEPGPGGQENTPTAA